MNATGYAGLAKARLKSPGRMATVRALLLGLLLSGCATVGPDYNTPVTPEPDLWHTSLEEGLHLAPLAVQELAAWWEALEDPILSNLIHKAVAGNLDLRQVELLGGARV